MDINEKLMDGLKEDLARSQLESDRRMEKMENGILNLEQRSIQNYADWRNYLHKYFTIVLAFIAGSGILASTQLINDYRLSYGILFALIGILIGFLGINIYFFIERKWFQAQHVMSGDGYYEFHTHPEVTDDDTLMAIKLNLKDKLSPFLKDLKDAKKDKDKKSILSLKKTIKARKKEIFLLSFVGQQFELIQIVWVSFVVVSITLTFIGITLVFLSVVNFS